MSKYGVFSGPYFPVFSQNSVKIRTRKTPYLDTFTQCHSIKIVKMSSYKEKKTVKNQRYFNEDCQDWLFESAFKNWLTKDKAQQKLTAMFFINQLNYLPAVDLPLQITEKAKKKKNRFL